MKNGHRSRSGVTWRMSRDVRDGVDESDESDEEDERWDEDDAMHWCEDEELTDAEEETREMELFAALEELVANH